MNYIELPFVKMSADAKILTRATEESAGLDFYSPADYIIPPHGQLLVPTQIKLRVPLGYYGRLASKSSLAILHQLHVGAGVIDPDYTGEIMVLLINTASHVHNLAKGTPIAQLILEKISTPPTKRSGRTSAHHQGSSRLWLLKCQKKKKKKNK